MNNEFFTAYDIRGRADNDQFVEVAWNVGKALADWLPTSGSVVVMSGEGATTHVTNAVVEGLRLQGREVIAVKGGDKVILSELIATNGYSGGALVSHDAMADEATLELYRDEGKLIESETGLGEIAEVVEAGNFVPSATKGELKEL